MPNADHKSLPSTLTFLALLIALISALVPPIIYFGLKFEYEKAAIEFEAESTARIITSMINRDPQYWRFHQYELDALSAKRRSSHPEQQTIISANQTGVVSESKDALDTPILKHTHPLYDAGDKVGTIEIRRSLRPVLVYTALLSLFSFIFGILVFAIVRMLPLRALRKTFSSLHEEKERAQITLDSIGDAVITTNASGKVTYLNQAASEILNTRHLDASEHDINAIFTLSDEVTRNITENPIYTCLMENRVIKSKEPSLLTLNDGWEYHIEYSASPIRDQHGTTIGAVMAFQDVTERIKTQEQLKYMAQYDALTGLPNRSLLHHHLEQLPPASQPAVLLFIDLDRFKNINDSLGHGLGDTLLFMIAQRLQYSVKIDDTVARLGGDEFAIIIKNSPHIDDTTNDVRNILENICQPLNLHGQVLFVTASIGIATIAPELSPEVLLQNAEIAMYRAKEIGRSSYQFFDISMNQLVNERLLLETALRHAIQRREFFLHFQPKLDLATGSITGAEALMRWHHPDMGNVPPSKFIPILEETDMILEAGEWLIHETCRQIKVWQSEGINLRVSVNISAKQLVSMNFNEVVKRLLEEADLPGSSLEFEITESIFLADIEQTESILKAIEALGITISIDDFGTGYSSLGYLKRFPISILKIDKSFIDHLAFGHEHRALVEATIVMGHALSMKVIAEGVETEAQRCALTEMKCDEIQGYLISRPVDPESFAKLHKKHLLQ